MTNMVEQSEAQGISDQEAFRLRMEDQVRQIREYRQAILKRTGRLLTPDEAALEWIERYAANFGSDHPVP